MGGVASIVRAVLSPTQIRAEKTESGREERAAKTKKAEEAKLSAALKLAQIATSGRGVLSVGKSSRKKLLGN